MWGNHKPNDSVAKREQKNVAAVMEARKKKGRRSGLGLGVLTAVVLASLLAGGVVALVWGPNQHTVTMTASQNYGFNETSPHNFVATSYFESPNNIAACTGTPYAPHTGGSQGFTESATGGSCTNGNFALWLNFSALGGTWLAGTDTLTISGSYTPTGGSNTTLTPVVIVVNVPGTITANAVITLQLDYGAATVQTVNTLNVQVSGT